jgi:hypothetical protein
MQGHRCTASGAGAIDCWPSQQEVRGEAYWRSLIHGSTGFARLEPVRNGRSGSVTLHCSGPMRLALSRVRSRYGESGARSNS